MVSRNLKHLARSQNYNSYINIFDLNNNIKANSHRSAKLKNNTYKVKIKIIKDLLKV